MHLNITVKTCTRFVGKCCDDFLAGQFVFAFIDHRPCFQQDIGGKAIAHQMQRSTALEVTSMCEKDENKRQMNCNSEVLLYFF